MRYFYLLASLVLLVACSSQPKAPTSTAVIYEGATLVNGGTAKADSAILVDNGKIIAVGAHGGIQAPAGARRVDLTGKTVIPALVDAHAHLGWAVLKTGAVGDATYTKENLIDHLQRVAYFGVAAVRNLGIDPGEAAYEVRASVPDDAAILRLAGRGMAMPNAGPGRAYWRPVAYGVATEAEARKAVQELVAKKVDIIKIWVDDRNGTVKKLPPALYRAIIDEAHKGGKKVVAHIFYLADAKDLLRAGIDGFAHGVRDRDVDDEFIKLIQSRPEVWVIPNLPENLDDAPGEAWLHETLPMSQVDKMREAELKRPRKELNVARDFFGIQSRNLAKLNAAGVKIGFGTDSSNEVGWNVHTELSDMVASGMTPAQVLTAATKTAAEIVGLDQLGEVAEGKSADFVVLDANPLDDIANTRRINRVILRGKEVDRTALARGFTGGQ